MAAGSSWWGERDEGFRVDFQMICCSSTEGEESQGQVKQRAASLRGGRASCQVVSEWSAALWTEGEAGEDDWFVIAEDTIKVQIEASSAPVSVSFQLWCSLGRKERFLNAPLKRRLFNFSMNICISVWWSSVSQLAEDAFNSVLNPICVKGSENAQVSNECTIFGNQVTADSFTVQEGGSRGSNMTGRATSPRFDF